MRVLQLVTTFGAVGGLEIYVARLSERLCAQGHVTAVIASNPIPTSPSEYDVVCARGFCDPSPVKALAGERQVQEYAVTFQPDVVLSHHTANGPLLESLDALYPTVEFVHQFLCAGGKLFRRGDRLCTHALGTRCLADWYLGPCGSHRSPLIAVATYRRAARHRDALKKITAVVVGSRYMREYLIQEGVSAERIHLSDNTIGIPAEQTARTPQNGNLLFVGRISYNKGVQYVIRALTLLDDEYRLTVVGDGYYRAALECLASDLGVADRVSFKGFLQGEALEAEYDRAAIAVAPSIYPEPVGLVVPEPRGRGLPVVAFDVGGLSEWAERYDQVYFAHHGSVESLAEKIVAARAATSVPVLVRMSKDTLSVKPLEQILCRLNVPKQKTFTTIN